MKVPKRKPDRGHTAAAPGFTLVEAVVASLIGAIVFASLYGGFAWGFANVKAARENLRATQILVKRVEAMRLCAFSQITNTTYNPATFTDYFDPRDQSSGGGGTVYNGTFSAAIPPSGAVPDAYRSNMFLVTVGVSWGSGNQTRSRSVQTYVAAKGIQSYISTGR